MEKLKPVLKKKIILKEDPSAFSLCFATGLQDAGKKTVEKYKIKVTLLSIKYLNDYFS